MTCQSSCGGVIGAVIDLVTCGDQIWGHLAALRYRVSLAFPKAVIAERVPKDYLYLQLMHMLSEM